MAKLKKDTRIPFTPEELQYIKDTPALKLKDLAFMLKRSYDSVRRKKWAMENHHRDVQTKLNCKKKTDEEIGVKDDYNIWTKAEEDLVLNSKLTDRELAIQMKRSIGSIQSKRYRLLKEKARKNG